MKKAVFVILTLLGLFAPPFAQAQFTCTTNNGQITITGYTGPGGAVAIPSVINGLPVTMIGPYAFEPNGFNPPTISNVTISNGITTIGDHAFAFNGQMTNMTMPNSITDIGTYAFVGCGSLSNIVIPNGVTNLENEAFYNCALTNVTIPGNVITIGEEAFYSCSHLTNVTIENGVHIIGAYAFASTGLTSVTIPASVTNIGRGPFAFAGCYSLTAINADPGNTIYSSVGGILFNHDQTTLVEYPGGLAGGFTISNTVTAIGDFAFGSCVNLTSIIIPDSVTNIGSFVFQGCNNLPGFMVSPQNQYYYSDLSGVLFDKGQTTIVEAIWGLSGNYSMPASVTSIAKGAFENTHITSITIPSNVTNIGDYAFASCGLTNVTIVYGVKNIANGMFENCPGLQGITIPNTITNIGDSAFTGCTALKSVAIPNSVTNIGIEAFAVCPFLTNITLPNTITRLNQGIFQDCGFTSLTIPNSVTSIGASAFNGCSSLTNVMIPNTVASIEDDAFLSCRKLSGVYFYGNAPALGSNVFELSTPTIYYLPGTTGWTSTFAGRPTALWTLPYPLILAGQPNFGAQTNNFGFTISWATNRTVIVQGSPTLANPAWQPLQTNTLTNGSFYFSDTQWTNYPVRFYRITTP